MDSIPELQRRRTIYASWLRRAIERGSDWEVLREATGLLEIDEQLNPSKDVPMTWKGDRTLPAICTYDRRALHMGADPGTVFTNEDDLMLYREIQEREAEG